MIGFKVSYLLVFVFYGSGVLCAPLCLAGDFDSQLLHILHTQVLSAEEPAQILSRVLDDVQATISQRWQGFKLFLSGSAITGLATKSSDIDINLHLPNFNFSSAPYVIEETKQLFQKQPALYTDLNGVHTPKFTLLSFIHIPTQRNIELVFYLFMYGEEAVRARKLFGYYFNLDERILPLARFIKYLLQIHGLAGRDTRTLSSYTVYVLIVFYLQQINMAPPVYVLQKDSTSLFFNNWNVGFNELPYSTTNIEILHQLLGGFFKYYSEFNFEEYIVSPFAGRPILRSAFTNGDNLPKNHFLNNYFNRTTQLKIKNHLNCSNLCIQDVFSLNENVGERVSYEYAMKFKYFMKSVTMMFEDLLSDRILRAILVTDSHIEPVINHINDTVGVLSEQNCIEVPDTSYKYGVSQKRFHVKAM